MHPTFHKHKNSIPSSQSSMAEVTKKYAVVTGANRGIGLEICKQLASKGIRVVLTARDEYRGIKAVEKLKIGFGLSDFIIFHQLDVTDLASIASLAEFVKSHFGKLDILINNAGIGGALVDGDALRASAIEGGKINWSEVTTQTYELALEGLQTNYYGAKRTTEALLPLLHLSHSPAIVYVSAEMGKLKNIHNEWAKGVLKNIDNLTEERIDEVLNEFLKDLKEELLEDKGWPHFFAAYTVSKAAMNAYTRLVAKKYSSIRVNSVCPGPVKTDLNYHTGILTVEEGALTPVRVALLPYDDDDDAPSPSGLFFVRDQVSSFDE